MSDLRISNDARLLVVDPEQRRGEELARDLRQAGYNDVSVIAAVVEEVANHGPGSPELVLVDLDRVRIGSALTDLVRAAPGAATPLIGLASDVTLAGRHLASTSGLDDFVLRSVALPELLVRIETALSRNRLRRVTTDRPSTAPDPTLEPADESGMVRESLSLLATIADFHDDDTDQHAYRVGVLSGSIAAALGLSERFVAMLTQAAPLHDLGKVGISRRILLKPGKLTPPEWMHMMQHVDIGGQILASSHSPVLRLAGEVARAHHERWDGSGYTAGLVGEEIPIAGRIVAVADVWDTLTHDRPYRKAWQPERALTEIRDQAGRHFDPRVVEAFHGLDLDALVAAADGQRLAA